MDELSKPVVRLLSKVEEWMFPNLCYVAGRKSRGMRADTVLLISNKDKLNFLKHLYEIKHRSIFEHVQFTFEIECSRACLDQLNRYRHASMCMESQRYMDMSTREYVVPPSILANPKAMEEYNTAIYEVQKHMENLKFMGIPNEDFRFIAGMGMLTSEIFTCNLREFMWIMEERLCVGAQWEIRSVVQQMKEALCGISIILGEFLAIGGPPCTICGKCRSKNG